LAEIIKERVVGEKEGSRLIRLIELYPGKSWSEWLNDIVGSIALHGGMDEGREEAGMMGRHGFELRIHCSKRWMDGLSISQEDSSSSQILLL